MTVTLDKDEHIVFEIRKHWFVLSFEITVAIIFILLPVIAYSIFTVLPIEFVVPGNALSLLFFLYAFWVLIVWNIMFVLWTNFYLDVWIVTDKKLIDVEQKGLFRRQVSTLHLSKIQDVTSEVHGIVQTALNFGDLHVQTAAQQREFVIRNISQPNETRKKINMALDQHQNRG
jgi:uncharacterized membrane protein YdbT with pleckstrin-like domain